MTARAPRLTPPAASSSVRWEVREVVRKRLFAVKTPDDVSAVIEELKRERAVGRISLNLGPGGIAQTLEFEERSKLPA